MNQLLKPPAHFRCLEPVYANRNLLSTSYSNNASCFMEPDGAYNLQVSLIKYDPCRCKAYDKSLFARRRSITVNILNLLSGELTTSGVSAR